MAATHLQYSDRQPALYVAFELGWSEWKLAFATAPADAPRLRAIGGRNTQAVLREIAKAKQRFGLPDEAPVYCCYEAGRDGFWLHRCLRIFNTTTAKQEGHFEVPLVGETRPDVVLASDGTVLAAYQSDAAQAREVFSDRLLPPCKVPKGVITNAAISADGRMLALAVSPIERVVEGRAFPDSTKPADIVTCELTTGQERARFTVHGSDVRPLNFSPSGDLLAYGDETDIRVYEVLSGKEVLRLLGHKGTIMELVFSTDGRKLVTGSIDSTALVWDIGQLSRTKPRPEQKVDRARLHVLWADLGGPDAAKAYKAIRTLAASSDSVPFLEQELLAAGTLFAERKAQVERLIPTLDSERYAERERATRELKNLREDAELLLRGMLADEISVEVRRRLTQVLGVMQGESPGPSTLRQLRAVETLELAGTPETRRVLQGLAKGPAECRLTREAKAALERLDKRHAN